jgi:2-aminophenol/2-amino-5-chlorophenol 1,6-dioxygenase subunit alpha
MSLKFTALVPGLPQLLAPSQESPHIKLKAAMQKLGTSLSDQGVQRIIYYSSQWLSVLGTMVQAKEQLRGTHVDPSWHQLGTFDYDIGVDLSLSRLIADCSNSAGYFTQMIDYDGFPVDTGTIVADSLLNPSKIRVTMISSWLYATYNQIKDFATVIGTAIANDSLPTAVIGISSLSGNYFPTDLDPREDHISSVTDDDWNRRIIALCERGALSEVDSLAGDYSKQCRVDVDFKVMAFLRGIGAAAGHKTAICHGYQAIHGTGAAILEFRA